MPLVSRRFRDASRDPSLWPALTVSHNWFMIRARWMSFLRWLAAKGFGLQSLVFANKVRALDRAPALLYLAWPCQCPPIVLIT